MVPEIRKLVVEIVEPHKTNNILITKHCRTDWFFHHCAQFKKVSSALSCTLSKSTDWNILYYQAELRAQFNSRLYDRLYIHCGALLWWRQLGLLGLLWVTNRVFKFRELRKHNYFRFQKVIWNFLLLVPNGWDFHFLFFCIYIGSPFMG